MKDWVIIKANNGKEQCVANDVKARGYEAVVPMEPRFKRVSQHSNRLVKYEIPLIPRYVFVSMPYWSTVSVREGNGFCRDKEGFLIRISDHEFQEFIHSFNNWSDRILKSNTPSPEMPKAKQRFVTMGKDTLSKFRAQMDSNAIGSSENGESLHPFK